MIEINLVPGGGKRARKGGGLKVDLGASLLAIREKIREPWLIGAVASAIVAVALVGGLYSTQQSRAATIDEALEKQVKDSIRYSSVLREREKAEAKRDTILRSLNMLRAIDDDRFIWPHIMDEVSSSLPPYTWIVSLGYTGAGQGQTPIATVVASEADTSGNPSARRKRRALATAIVRDTIRIRMVGNTVDIQALTRFMKQLETSTFLEQVQLAKSERANDNGKEVTQFQLDMLYSRPGPMDVRRVPLALSVR
jgi:Tfp pilus assembly protein PilN